MLKLNVANPLETFFQDPERYFAASSKSLKVFTKNGQLYELGLDADLHDPESVSLYHWRKMNLYLAAMEIKTA